MESNKMIVYHVDKLGILFPGKNIKQITSWTFPDPLRQQRIRTLNRLYGGKLTLFGVQSLDAFEDKAADLEMTELIMDYVRALAFPALPSRLTVFFASRTVESARQWLSVLSLTDCLPQLVALETSGPVFAANVQYRDEVNNRVSALCKELLAHQHNQNPQCAIPSSSLSSLASQLLGQCISPALDYWESLSPVYSSDEPPLFDKEELLCVPPVRVLYRI